MKLRKKPRVLIADDHPDLVKAITRVLALDYEVVGVVADGSAVVEAAQRLRPDVIVVDLNLPNVNGLEACRQITQVNPDTKVVVFTAMEEQLGLRLEAARGPVEVLVIDHVDRPLPD